MANYGKSCVDSHFGMRPKEGLRYGQSTDKQKVFYPNGGNTRNHQGIQYQCRRGTVDENRKQVGESHYGSGYGGAVLRIYASAVA